MVFGNPGKERIQLNEESLWAGAPVEAWPSDYLKHLNEVRRLVFENKNAEANAYGLKHLTAGPTSFCSYEPLGDLWLDFAAAENPASPGYRRELNLADGNFLSIRVRGTRARDEGGGRGRGETQQ
jgi:alpha-L-fucosidase 2